MTVCRIAEKSIRVRLIDWYISIASTTMKDPTKSESIPIAEEQLRKVTIGEPNVVNSTIAIVDYDPVWPVLFEEEARRIRAALGEQQTIVVLHAREISR